MHFKLSETLKSINICTYTIIKFVNFPWIDGKYLKFLINLKITIKYLIYLKNIKYIKELFGFIRLELLYCKRNKLSD